MGEELSRLSADMLHDVLGDWLQVNRLAALLYEGLPPDAQDRARQQALGWDAMIPVLALMDPYKREMARLLLEDAVAAADASLSHPLLIVEDKTETDVGASEVNDQVEERLDALEAATRLVSEALASLEDTMDRISPETSSSGGRPTS